MVLGGYVILIFNYKLLGAGIILLILMLACTGNMQILLALCKELSLSGIARVKFLRIPACFLTLLVSLPVFYGFLLITTPSLWDKLFSSYQHLFHHTWKFALTINAYSMKYWNVHTQYLTHAIYNNIRHMSHDVSG